MVMTIMMMVLVVITGYRQTFSINADLHPTSEIG
jgi:hypothetical protein